MPDTSDSTSPAPDAKPPSANATKPRRKWLRRLVITCIVLIVAIPLLWIGATRSAFTRKLIASQLESIFDAEIDAHAIIVQPSGWIVVRDAVVRAKGIQGPGGAVFEIDRLAVLPVWRTLLGDNPRLREVTMDGPLLRFSQSVDDGSVNVAAIRLPSGGGTPLDRPPLVAINGGVLELGEHRADGTYLALRKMNVSGAIRPDPQKPGEWIVGLREHARDPNSGVRVDGRVANGELSLALSGLAFDSLPLESVPTTLRSTFRQLDLRGKIGTTSFTYTRDGDIDASIELVNVGINLPVEVQPEEDEDGNQLPVPPEQQGRLMRMEKVNGVLRMAQNELTGAFTGEVEGLPYRVRMSYGGTTAIAPFTVELAASGFELTKQPQIMRFAPGVAQRRMTQFSDPTGIMDATITVRRPAPVDGKAADLLVSGDIILRDGTASFQRFPYEFKNVTGHWRFDEGQIEIVRVEGTAPSGAHIVGYGHIAPPTSEAAVDLDLEITNLPVDDELSKALGSRKRIIDALFSAERYKQLLASGLVMTPAHKAEIEARLAALARGAAPTTPDEAAKLHAELVTPAFEPGATVRVGVRIQRQFGENGEWTDAIGIELGEAYLLPEVVPYPLIARNVTILKQNDGARVFGGHFEGIRGGHATAEASVDLLRVDDPNLPFTPDISLTATDVPFDRLLLNALPDSVGDSGASPKKILRDLGVEGYVTGVTAKVGMGADNEPAYTVDLDVLDGSALPRPADATTPNARARVFLSEIEGHVRVTERLVQANLTGRASSVEGDPRDGAPITLNTKVVRGGSQDTVDLVATAKHLDLALTLEDLAAPFSDESATDLGKLRRDSSIAGIGDAKLTLSRSGDSTKHPMQGVIELTDPLVTLTHKGRRLQIADATGTLAFSFGEAKRVAFTQLDGDVFSDGAPIGRLRLNGRATVEGAPSGPGEKIDVAVSAARFESVLTDIALDEGGSPRLRTLRDRYRPRGSYDASLTLAPGARAGDGWSVTGEFHPHELTVWYQDRDLEFARTSGRIGISPGGGELRELALDAGDWSLQLDGAWRSPDEKSPTEVQTAFALRSTAVPDSLRGALPRELVELMDDLKVVTEGSLAVDNGNALLVLPADDDAPVGVKVSGRLSADRMALDAGVEVKDADLVADFEFARLDATKPSVYDLRIASRELTAMDVQVEESRARITSGAGGDVLVPLFAGECHGGRIAGTAAVRAPVAEGAPREFEAEVRLSDVRFASLLADLQDKPAPAEGKAAAGLLELNAAPLDESRGRLDGEFSMAGISGNPLTRRGRGFGTVGGARVANFPLVVPLIRVTNLQLPLDERLDYASAQFYLEGETATIEDLSLSSASVMIQGSGTAEIPSKRLDLRFKARNKVGIPIISKLLEGIRNELVSAEVGGTLSDPKMRLIPLGGTSRRLEQALGRRSEEEARLDRLERGAGGARDRTGERLQVIRPTQP